MSGCGMLILSVFLTAWSGSLFPKWHPIPFQLSQTSPAPTNMSEPSGARPRPALPERNQLNPAVYWTLADNIQSKLKEK
jgi:hypothetical protein